MVKNFKLTIEYDGSCYHGWQIQKNGQTIQGEIQKNLMVMTGQKIVLNGSGRTDAGVHALGQTANFKCATHLSAQIFQKGLNSLLKDDIVIKNCQEVSEDFHARFKAKDKTYNYHILNQPLPSALGRQYVWWLRKPLNLESMKAASYYLIGEHDFKAFEGTGSPRVHTIRKVSEAQWLQNAQKHLIFQIRANGFLRYMVRNIVGTLVDVGLGKISPADFKAVLDAKDRSKAGATAPPQGLFLMQVYYEKDDYE